MAKKINYATINTEALNILSKWNIAYFTKKDVCDAIRKKITAVDKELTDIAQKRAEAQKNGMTLDQAVQTYSQMDQNQRKAILEADLKETRKQFTADENAAKALVPNSLYDSYCLRKVAPSAYQYDIKKFLAELGLSGTDTQIGKLADYIAAEIASGKATAKSKSEGNYMGNFSKATYKDLVIRVFLQFLVVEKQVVISDPETHALSIKVFEDEAAEETTAA